MLCHEAWNRIPDLTEDDFQETKNRKIFSALKELRDKGDSAEEDGWAIRIVKALKAKDDFEAVGGTNELARLVNLVPNGAHSEYYLQAMRNDS